MKIIGEPNLIVNITKRNNRKKLPKKIQFDSEGIYLTDDERLIKVLSQRFKVEKQEFKCKKCDFVSDNMGDLLVHYRQAHPKGGD
jgi:hypothetical protein